jgi:CheY-specific phosphatase CheX
MSPDTSLVTRSHEENWQPVLELAVEEVFEIMLACRVKPVSATEHPPSRDFTAMVGLAGALAGIITVCCSTITASCLAKAMLGAAAESEGEVADALGEICNMVSGNFESGSAKMKSTSQAAFDRIASMLRAGDYRLRIEGHTDNAPIHNAQFPSNWELSTSRSTEIVRLLIVRDGYGPDRLSAAGYAEFHPVSNNLTAEGRGANRRVDIVILGKPQPTLPTVQSKSEPNPGSSTVTKKTAVKKAARPASPTPTLKPAVVHAVEGHLPH